MTERPKGHSPLGASGSYRWLPEPWGGGCTASVKIAEGIEDPESDYAQEGTAAHALAEVCLIHEEEAWKAIGYHVDAFGEFHKEPGNGRLPITKNMADAVQVYLSAIRQEFPHLNKENSWIEREFWCPSLHPLMFGRVDFAHLTGRHLHVVDYKHGAGIVVDAFQNPQAMYYAAGLIEQLGLWSRVDQVTLWIAQPRGWHHEGPIRKWTVEVSDLEDWLDTVLLPAMEQAEVSRDTKSGEHCRFCPARGHACPQIISDLKELEGLMQKPAEELSDTELGRFFTLLEVAKIAGKRHREIIFGRLQAGRRIPGTKLVPAKANRAWKDGADAALVLEFGKEAYVPPSLKSPAQVEELPKGKAFTTRYAYKPDAGLTVVADHDARPKVDRDVKGMFQAATQKRKGAAA